MKTPRTFLALPALLFTACLPQDDAGTPQDAATAEDDSGDSNQPIEPNYPTISGPNCGSTPCNVAVNGVMQLGIFAWDAQNPRISFAKGLFAVNWQLGRDAEVTATAAGEDELLIQSDNLKTVALPITAKEVKQVEVVPAGNYWTKAKSFAYLAKSSTLQVVLKPNASEQESSSANHLIDQSLSLPADSAFAHAGANYSEAWDVFVVADDVGDIPFTVSGNSFGTRTLTVPVTSQIDRIEATLLKTDLEARDNQTVCFNAYAADLEVIGNVAWHVQGDMTDRHNPSANCVAFTVGPFGGDYTISATVGDLSSSVMFSAPRALRCNDNICEFQEYGFCDSCPVSCGDGVCVESELGNCPLDCFGGSPD